MGHNIVSKSLEVEYEGWTLSTLRDAYANGDIDWDELLDRSALIKTKENDPDRDPRNPFPTISFYPSESLIGVLSASIYTDSPSPSPPLPEEVVTPNVSTFKAWP